MNSNTEKRMKATRLLRLITAVLGMLAATPAMALISLDTVPVGDIGNPNDTTGRGGVAYAYSIGKYEVTLDQYNAFLNAVGATDTYGLYSSYMGSFTQTRGIARSGSAGSYTYSVIGSGNRPVTWVSWFDAARFVNWLENGQPMGAQDASTTERGAYTLDGALSGVGFARNSGTTYGLPTENEWYKAAYYQPAAQGGDSDGYWLYPTSSNLQPNSRKGSATDPNSANYYYNDNIANGFNGGFAVNKSTTSPTGNALTDAGAFSLATSFYGTSDQGGNVSEWNDAIIEDYAYRAYCGGSWFYGVGLLCADYVLHGLSPEQERETLGFRIVRIPEPTAAGLITLGTALLLWRRRPTFCRIASQGSLTEPTTEAGQAALASTPRFRAIG